MSIPRRRFRGLAFTIVAATATLAITLTGCAGSPQTSAQSDAPTPGGNLTFAIGNDPLNLNPSAVGPGNDTWYVTRQLVDSLVYQNPDTLEFEPWLAESWDVNADATAYTFTLRAGVTFSDGSPLTARDVKGTFDDIVAAGAAAAAAPLLIGYAATEVVDEQTARVTFSAPNAAFISAAATTGLGIVGATTLAVPYAERADGSAVVGTGPFTLASYAKDVATELERRADYAWAPAAIGNSGAAHLDSVTFQVVPEAGVRAGSLSSEQVDVAGGIQPVDVAQLESAGFPVISRANPGLLFGTVFNAERPAVSDVVVREAIARAINAEEIRDTALSELFAVGTSALSSTTPGFAEQSAHYGFDPARAAALLDGAGWVLGADGIRAKNGERLSLTLIWITNFGPNQTSLEVLQQQLRAAGIEIELVGGPSPDFIERQKSGDFDIAWVNLSRADGDVLRTTFSQNGNDYYNVRDTQLEALFATELEQPASDERAATFALIQERLASQYYSVPVHELTSILGTAPNVHGLQLGADSRLDTLSGVWLAP